MLNLLKRRFEGYLSRDLQGDFENITVCVHEVQWEPFG